MDVAGLRAQIPVCQAMTYVNTGWSGPSPLRVVNAIKERLDYEMDQGPTSPEVYESGKEIQSKAREAVVRLLNASTEEVCLTQNTTEGLNMVINGLPWRQGDEIITCDLEHSSVLVPGYFQQHRHGAVVKVLSIAPNEEPDRILEKIEAAISARTRLVFLSHVEYSSGLRMPVREIRQLTKKHGALLLLDGAQSTGQMPLDMGAMDCDFYSMPGQKWLLGPEGVGALYIRRDLIEQVEPVHVSSRAARSTDDPFSFEPDPSTIDKLLLSSTSVALQAGFLEGIEFVRGIGIDRIQERNLDLAGQLKEALAETPGVRLISPVNRNISTGLVSFAMEGVSPPEAVSRLWQEHRIVARHVSFPAGIRVSLHFFNTEEEVQQVVDAVRDLA